MFRVDPERRFFTPYLNGGLGAVERVNPSNNMAHPLDADEVLSRLFGSVSRARILQLLVSKAGRAFYQREIMFETGLSLQPTQRELKNLFELGIIQKRETADRVYYEADSSSPLFKALVELCKSAQRRNGTK